MSNRRQVIQTSSCLFLERKPGCGVFTLVERPFGVFAWNPNGEYRLSDVRRMFRTFKAANKWCMKHWNDEKPHVVKTLALVSKD